MVIEQLIERCRSANPRIVLSEGNDPRIIEAAARAARDGLGQISVVADGAEFSDLARGVTGADQLDVLTPGKSEHTERYAERYFQMRQHKGATKESARAAVETPLGFAAMMVREADADGTVGGAVHTTADTVRAALQIIGKAPDADVVSSFFLMLLPEPHARPVVFADCGLILQPTAEELASIAIASAGSLKALTDLEPKCAMLSFSTKGSVAASAHESLGRIQRALGLVGERAPDLPVDGELQFDAAIVPSVASRKAPGSPVAGEANVFVFPSLSAGNIGYKIAQRIGGAVALGPVLQGLAAPANDLSRGCSADDVYQMIAITGAQAAARSG